MLSIDIRSINNHEGIVFDEWKDDIHTHTRARVALLQPRLQVLLLIVFVSFGCKQMTHWFTFVEFVV